MNKFLAAAALAVASIGTTVAPANAALIIGAFDANGEATFENLTAGPGAFSDSVVINFPSVGFANGTATSTSIKFASEVNFSSITLSDSKGVFASFTKILGGVGVAELWNLELTSVPATATLTFNGTAGASGGRYNGTVAFAPVPEPAAWALMITGFGMVGFAMRNRRSSVMTVTA